MFIRFILTLLASIIVITLLKGVIGIVMKGLASLVGNGAGSSGGSASTPRQDVPLSGELKRDPVCGTFISTASSTKKTVGGQVIHFCSVECRDKHKI